MPCLESGRVKEIEIDMSQAENIDSSGLGMLLLLKDKAKALGKNIILAKCHAMVLKSLEGVGLEKVFKMIWPDSNAWCFLVLL